MSHLLTFGHFLLTLLFLHIGYPLCPFPTSRDPVSLLFLPFCERHRNVVNKTTSSVVGTDLDMSPSSSVPQLCEGVCLSFLLCKMGRGVIAPNLLGCEDSVNFCTLRASKGSGVVPGKP